MAEIYVTTAGNDTTGDGTVGNPYASPGRGVGAAVAGDRVNIKSGNYTNTTSTANVAAGRMDIVIGVRVEGYATTAGDLGAPPVISAGSTTGVVMATLNGANAARCAGLVNVTLNGNSGAGNKGVRALIFTTVCFRVRANNCPSMGFDGDGERTFTPVRCFADACGQGFYSGSPYGCAARACDNSFDAPWFASRCLATGCTGFAFSLSNVRTRLIGCVANRSTYNNITAANDIYANVGCVSTRSGSYGWGDAYTAPMSVGSSPTFIGNAHWNNTSGSGISAATYEQGTVALSADPWANEAGASAAADLDALFACFLPNTTAGGGAALRAAGFPGFLDIGAMQHEDAGGGGGMVLPRAMNGGYSA